MMDEYMEPMNDFEFGDGLNASRYCDYLLKEHEQASDCYMQGHSVDGGTDLEGIVTYNVDDLRVTVGFLSCGRPGYHATVSVDVFTGKKRDRDKLLRLFYRENKQMITMRDVGSYELLMDPGPIPDPDDPDLWDEDFSQGIRLSHPLSVGNCTGGIGRARMELIHMLTEFIVGYIRNTLDDHASK
ncbi:MAG: hypothetical protein IKS87_02070 [Lachnospiraceae bacterium]|nr:hypothetical protein [Lachnospiraceae bacterium]